jgi:hypothetical protein
MEVVVFLLLILLIPPLLLHRDVFHTEGRVLPSFLSIFAALMFAGFARAHRFVHGFADEEGIHYQRYVRWRHVNWGHIESITKRPLGRILVDLQGYNFFNRHLEFMQDAVLFGDRPKSLSFADLRSAWIRGQQFRVGPMRGA